MKMKADAVIVGTGVGGLFSALNLPRDKKIIMITPAITKTVCEIIILTAKVMVSLSSVTRPTAAEPIITTPKTDKIITLA